MKNLKSDPRVVFYSTLVYRFLLSSYPKDFQREYALSMAQVFRDCCLRAFHTRGLLGMLSLWSLTLVDYIKSAFDEYTWNGVHMNASRFIRLGGWALILGTAVFFTDLSVEVRISGHGSPFDPYNVYSRPIDQLLASLPNVLILSSMILFTIGVMGLYLRYGPGAGLLGRTGLVVGMTGAVFSLITCAAGGSEGLTIFLRYNEVGGWWLWDLAALAIFLLFSGIFIFGIDAVKLQLLSHWNFIPMLSGVLIPLRILAGYLQQATMKGFNQWLVDMNMINTLVLIFTSIGLVALGILLISEPQQEQKLVMG